ncbi:MAG: hypothetical protein ACOX2O_02900 [Bdellovibrionota bacterium]
MNIDDCINMAKIFLKFQKDPFKVGVDQLNFVDDLVDMGESPDEISFDVKRAIAFNSFLFFGWLLDHGHGEATETFTQLLDAFFNYVYLNNTEEHKRLKVSNVTKKQLEKFFNLVEFGVSQELWDKGINPFDGMLLLYQYLEESGYKNANLERRRRAITELRKSATKKPLPLNVGYTMIH